MKIAILSDIHAVAGAYRQALADARSEGFDQLVILGDLLTYGVDPEETLDLTQEALERDQAAIVRGNHDELYMEGPSTKADYIARMPDWIRESFEWTAAKVVGSNFWRTAAWHDELPIGELLLAHANPFGVGNWRYLNDTTSLNEASLELERRAFRWGVFGHVHRFRCSDAGGPARAFTVGSIGQPREIGGISQWAMACLSDGRFTIEPRPVEYDWRQQRMAVLDSALSAATKERIMSYFG